MKTKIKPICKSQLNDMLNKAISQVENLGIELERSIIPTVRTYKATSYFGQINYRRNLDKFEITISEYHLKNGYYSVMQTMVHEVLHACKGSRGHGEQWREYARQVNRVYGYQISRVQSYEQGCRLPKREKKIRYIIECSKCGDVFRRQRKSRLVKETHRYKCGRCGGKLVRVV